MSVAEQGAVAGRQRVRRGRWMRWENCEAALKEIEVALGHFPSDRELFELGHGGLRSALRCYHGGYNAARVRCGSVVLHVSESPWRSFERVEADLRRICGSLGHFPSGSELQELNEWGLLNGIGKFHGGLNAVRRKMGVKVHQESGGFWKDWTPVEAGVRTLILQLGAFPTYTDFVENDRLGLYMAIRTHHGGIDAVRVRMGYVAVCDKHIAHHADALACVIPELGASPECVWRAIKARWCVDDLDRAIADYQTTGSLTGFQQLLNGTSPVTQD